jgi:hypothetical protein
VLTVRSSGDCAVMLSILIMLVFLDYAALNAVAVNVAFVVSLLVSLLCLLRHYLSKLLNYVHCLVKNSKIV